MSGLKSYNLVGDEKAGKTLVGNWLEEREWKDNISGLKRSTHGLDLTAQPGYEEARFQSETQSAYRAPDVRHKKVPPREARRRVQAMTTLSREMKAEEEAAEDHSIQFTRGRYLKEPQLHPEFDERPPNYLKDEPITLYSDRPHNFGKDSHFTKPIQDYVGDRLVKDD